MGGAPLMALTNANGPGRAEIMNVQVATAGTYFVGVTSVGGTTGTYKLAVFPGPYDPASIAGGDGNTTIASVPAGQMVVGASNFDPAPYDPNVMITGDELFTLGPDGSVSNITHYQVPNLVIQDPDLSAGRTKIAYASTFNGARLDVYVVDLAAQRTVRLSPDALPCPMGSSTVGFNRPTFLNENEVVVLGECFDGMTELDVIMHAPSDGSAAAAILPLQNVSGSTCVDPHVVPRARRGSSQVGVSAVGCAWSATDSFSGGQVRVHNVATGNFVALLDVLSPASNFRFMHNHLSGWDFSPDGLRYAVVSNSGVYEYSVANGALLRGPYAVNRPMQGDYWNRETLTYSPDGTKLAYTRYAGTNMQLGDYFEVDTLNLAGGTWSQQNQTNIIRRGAGF